MLRAAVARYASFFRLPDVTRLLVMAVLARMPIGTVTLAMLLHVRALTGSFAAAGAAVGSYLGASAVTAPLVGRWIDRHGARAALLVTGTGCPAALLALWLAKPLALTTPMLWLVAGLAGAFSPPISVLTRTMWRYRFDDEAARTTAFALDAVLVEFAFTAGPALIALLLAVGSPALAFGAAFVFATLAVPVFVASPALRYWRHDPRAKRHLLGPLAEPRLLAVYATTFLLASGLGLLEVAYPGFAAQAHRPPLAGLLIATNSIGSAIGGLVYGGLGVALARERQLRRVLGMLVLPLVAQALIGSAGWLALVAFVAGLCIAPSMTIVTLLISSYAPARYATEAFTWSATFIVSGVGAGTVLGGVLLERLDSAAVFASAGSAALLAAGCAFALRR
ncbi:MAG TPA: MFS transporter [Casimicrobiaceae bacterium]|jgi:MFS family permease